jgi:hypothetical protein
VIIALVRLWELEAVLLELYGPCVVCGKTLGEADYEFGNIVAAIGPEGTVVMCTEHLTEDAPHGPKYRAAVRAMALAKADQLRALTMGNGPLTTDQMR